MLHEIARLPRRSPEEKRTNLVQMGIGLVNERVKGKTEVVIIFESIDVYPIGRTPKLGLSLLKASAELG